MKTLNTERLMLRKFQSSDLDDLYDYAKNPNVGPDAGWEPHVDKSVSKKILDMFIEEDEVWAIVNKASNKVIGSIGLHDDRKRNHAKAKMIGYVLSETHWGKGLITEAAKAIIKHAFEDMALELISVYHYPFNEGSKRVIEKCGFKYEGTLRQSSTIYNGNVYDDVCYSMTREAYERLI